MGGWIVKLRRAAFACACLVLAATPAGALPRGYSGADLVRNCSDANLCDVFLGALLDGHDTLLTWANAPSYICPPRQFTSAELWPATAATLQSRPERIAASAGSLTIDALQVTFRCASAGLARPMAVISAPRTGVDLIYLCWNPVLCDAFLYGVLDAHQTLVDWQRLPGAYLCLPETAEPAEMRVALLTYLGERPPDQLNYSAASLALLAMVARYPCQ